jgi:hypothetical protein
MQPVERLLWALELAQWILFAAVFFYIARLVRQLASAMDAADVARDECRRARESLEAAYRREEIIRIAIKGQEHRIEEQGAVHEKTRGLAQGGDRRVEDWAFRLHLEHEERFEEVEERLDGLEKRKKVA